MPFVPSSFLLLVVMPGATSSFLLCNAISEMCADGYSTTSCLECLMLNGIRNNVSKDKRPLWCFPIAFELVSNDLPHKIHRSPLKHTLHSLEDSQQAIRIIMQFILHALMDSVWQHVATASEGGDESAHWHAGPIACAGASKTENSLWHRLVQIYYDLKRDWTWLS